MTNTRKCKSCLWRCCVNVSNVTLSVIVELHLFGLTDIGKRADMQKIRIIGFFFENRLRLKGKSFLQTTVLSYIFIYL